METASGNSQIFDYQKHNEVFIGWQKMKDNFSTYFAVAMLIVLLDDPFGLLKHLLNEGLGKHVMVGLSSLYFFTVRPAIHFGSQWLFLRGIRDEPIDSKEVFWGFKKYKDVVLAHLISTGLIAIGFVLFVFPGIIVLCRLSFVSYLVMDKNLPPLEAVHVSWKMTEDKMPRIFVLGFGGLILFIVGIFFFGVGALIAIIWTSAYFAVYYDMCQREWEENEDSNQSREI